MLPEVLSSLNEVKARLQERLLQQPEYPALLIVDKAAQQLDGVLTLLQPQTAPTDRPEEGPAAAPLKPAAAAEPPSAATPARAPAPRGEPPYLFAPRLVQNNRP